jgi:hypothetical protein
VSRQVAPGTRSHAVAHTYWIYEEEEEEEEESRKRSRRRAAVGTRMMAVLV